MTSNQNIPKNHKIAILFIISFLAIIYWLIFDFLRQIEFDTASFVGASRYMFNLEGGYNFQSRLSKPLVLILPGIFELLAGIHPRHIFLIQNISCYYALGFIVYKTILLLTDNTKQALLGVIVYFMCQPFAVYSLFFLVDTVGWLIGFYSIYLTIKHIQKQLLPKTIILISLTAGFGMLAKESAVVGIIFLGIVLMLESYPLIQKAKYILLALLVFLLPFLISNAITQKLYGVSVFQRIIEQQTFQGFVFYNKGNFQQVYRIIDVYWVLFALGFSIVMKSKAFVTTNKIVFALLVTALISLMFMPLYPFIVDRILFMIAPLLIVFIVMGATAFQKFSTLVVVSGGVINILMTWIIYRFNMSGILFSGLFLYIVILIILFFVLKSKPRANFI